MSNQTIPQQPDKFESHYRQQLSALVDGELATDEARFLLRRLEHDGELAGFQERWQLYGDVMRGRGAVLAPVDFAARVRAAVEAEPLAVAVADGTRPRRAWRWGGGAALAASVAAVALFMARERLPDDAPAADPLPVLATTAEVPQRLPAAAPAVTTAEAGAALAAAAVPAVRAGERRRTTARPQQRGTVAAAETPAVAIAAQAPAADVPSANPFAHPSTLQARPWPRSAIAGAGDSALNASFSSQPGATTFYPFEPRMPQPAEAADNGSRQPGPR